MSHCFSNESRIDTLLRPLKGWGWYLRMNISLSRGLTFVESGPESLFLPVVLTRYDPCRPVRTVHGRPPTRPFSGRRSSKGREPGNSYDRNRPPPLRVGRLCRPVTSQVSPTPVVCEVSCVFGLLGGGGVSTQSDLLGR